LLRETGRSSTASRRVAVAQQTLVVFQMGLAVFVLFVAGLLVRTLQSLEAIDTGLAADRVAVVELSWPDRKFGNGQQVAAFYDALLPRIRALPGVVSAATVNVVPFTGATGGWDGPFVADGTSSPVAVFNLAVTGADYFETMGIDLRSGRPFDDRDREGSVPVAVVSERAARLLGGDSAIIGRRIRFAESQGEWRTIVGVAPETRYRAIREAAPTVYIPAAQFTDVMTMITTLAVRTGSRPGAVIRSIRDTVSQTDPDVSVLNAATLRDLVADQFTGPRLNALVVAILSAGAVLLAIVGLYSLLAGIVRTRRRELAIRQAIGATPARLRRMVVGQGLLLCACGLCAGLAAGMAVARVLSSVLYGVTYADAQTVLGVVSLLTFAALAAGYIPARQATRSDLSALLRAE
jgi:putative ABC transport system permease protein